MGKIRTLYIHWLCRALLLAAMPLSAQQDGAVLSVETASGQDTFHIGERVPLKLTFSSPNDTGYLVSPLIRGRGGEGDCNRFEVVSPSAGWSDPFEMYFKQDLMYSGHGWPWQPLKSSKPIEASVDLNEWIRFDQPGEYTVKVSSFCVSRVNRTGDYSLSKTIKLQIVPATPEWQAEKFQSLKPNLDLLDHPERHGSEQQFLDARGDLKYLATPQAIDEMTYRLRDEKYNFADQCAMALIGLPPAMRETVIASMNNRLEEPDFPIYQYFVSTLLFLHVTPGSDKESIRKQEEADRPLVWASILSAVSKKQPVARARTVQTLLLAEGLAERLPNLDARLGPLLVAAFADLNESQQADDLMHHWDLLRSGAMLPALQKLAKTRRQYVPASQFGDVKMAAFRRWYELDPAGAHDEILAQMASASPQFSAIGLDFMPREQLPQLEQLWANEFARTTNQEQATILGSLLVEFGAGGAKAEVQAILNTGGASYYTCPSHVLALAYLTRFSPNEARSAFKREFALDLDHCNGDVFRLIRQWTSVPDEAATLLNEAALDALDSENPRFVRDALEHLGLFGMKADEQPILDHFLKWSEKWRGRATALDTAQSGGFNVKDNSSPVNPQATLDEAYEGNSYANALLANQGWLPDDTLRAKVLANCVGEAMCAELKKPDNRNKPPYMVSGPDLAWAAMTGTLVRQSFNVAQFQPQSLEGLDDKVRQYPRGTHFQWMPRPGAGSDQKKLEDQVREIFRSDGMVLTNWPN